MEHVYYFFDESGNSGSKFWDLSQPTYVEAGWAVDKNQVKSATDAFKKVEDSYPVKSKKVKGKKLNKHSRGQNFILETISEIGKNGGIPTVHIVEKKYWVCGKVVETFMDPDYNSKISFEETLDLERRQAAAQFFYDMDSPLLEKFAVAYREKDPNAILVNAMEWVEELKHYGAYEFSDIMANVVPEIENHIHSEFSAYELPEYDGIDSMNVPVWFYIFQHIEQNTPSSKCSIVHHQMDTYEAAYRAAFDTLKNSGEGIVAFKDRQWVFPLKKIQNLFFEVSAECPLIRSADFIASSVAQYIKLAVSGAEISIPLHQIGFLTLGIFLMDVISYQNPQIGPPLNLGTILGSRDWVKCILNSLCVSGRNMKIA